MAELPKNKPLAEMTIDELKAMRLKVQETYMANRAGIEKIFSERITTQSNKSSVKLILELLNGYTNLLNTIIKVDETIQKKDNDELNQIAITINDEKLELEEQLYELQEQTKGAAFDAVEDLKLALGDLQTGSRFDDPDSKLLKSSERAAGYKVVKNADGKKSVVDKDGNVVRQINKSGGTRRRRIHQVRGRKSRR